MKLTAMAAAVLSMIFMACSHSEHSEHSHSHDNSHSHEHKDVHSHDQHAGHSHEGHTHNAMHTDHEDGVIVMSVADAEYFGVYADTISTCIFGDVLNVSGRLESAPNDIYTAVSASSGIISLTNSLKPGAVVKAGTLLATVNGRNIAGGDVNESAYIDMETAKREFERLKPLHAEGIVSTKDYNAAEAEYKRATAAYSGVKSGSSIDTKITGTVTDIFVKDGEYVETGTPIAVITKGERLIIKADVPARSLGAIGDKMTGNIRFIGNDSIYSLDELNVKKLSSRTDNMNGGFVPVYLEIDNRVDNIVAGMAVDIFMTGNGRNNVIAVPVESVSEQQGVHFVYLKLDDDCYRKVPVTIGRNDGRNVEVKQGLKAGDIIVTRGTIFIKLAESNGAVPEGHTHNH